MSATLLDPKPLAGEITVNERADVISAPPMDPAVRGLADAMLVGLQNDMAYLGLSLPDCRYSVTYESGARLRLEIDGGDVIIRFTHA